MTEEEREGLEELVRGCNPNGNASNDALVTVRAILMVGRALKQQMQLALDLQMGSAKKGRRS